MKILAINTGSSTIKLAELDEVRILSRAHFARADETLTPIERLRAFAHDPGLVVHRVVHGGTRFSAPTEIDASVENALAELIPLAPLHLPVELEWIRAARQAFPRARQLALFDTAFFAALPEVARLYALPPEVGARRYGFHGLAHEALWRQLGRARGRAITLQLGSGCSAAAILDGRPLDTSMGMTPLEGLVMATRPGDLDPGILIHLMNRGSSSESIDQLLNERSGLLGLSGESDDMRVLARSGSEGARRARSLYAYRIKKYIGAYLAVLGGVDAIAFGGGVGEHDAEIRAAALEGLVGFGIRIAPERNRSAAAPARIDAGGPVDIWVLSSDEEEQMAAAARAFIGQAVDSNT